MVFLSFCYDYKEAPQFLPPPLKSFPSLCDVTELLQAHVSPFVKIPTTQYHPVSSMKWRLLKLLTGSEYIVFFSVLFCFSLGAYYYTHIKSNSGAQDRSIRNRGGRISAMLRKELVGKLYYGGWCVWILHLYFIRAMKIWSHWVNITKTISKSLTWLQPLKVLLPWSD